MKERLRLLLEEAKPAQLEGKEPRGELQPQAQSKNAIEVADALGKRRLVPLLGVRRAVSEGSTDNNRAEADNNRVGDTNAEAAGGGLEGELSERKLARTEAQQQQRALEWGRAMQAQQLAVRW